MIQTAIVGVGYWGLFLLRNLVENEDIEVKWICDSNPKQLQNVRKRYPWIPHTTKYPDLLCDNGLDLILISTPVRFHFDLGMKALSSGKHLLLTKPMAETSVQCEQLINLAERKKNDFSWWITRWSTILR